MREVEGDLIKLALAGEFDVITHGVNCQCTMGAGIAPQMAGAFGCDKFLSEHQNFKGEINKLGQIEYESFILKDNKAFKYFPTMGKKPDLIVVNSYTQFMYGKNHTDGVKRPLDYNALILCMKKINHIFRGMHIGLPGVIGCGLAGGTESIVKAILRKELKDCNVTLVYLPKNK